MSDLIRKTYVISPDLAEKIEQLASASCETGLDLSDSKIVRMALSRGLPMLDSILISQEEQPIDEHCSGHPALV